VTTPSKTSPTIGISVLRKEIIEFMIPKMNPILIIIRTNISGSIIETSTRRINKVRRIRIIITGFSSGIFFSNERLMFASSPTDN
jgi:hypothetical protein